MNILRRKFKAPGLQAAGFTLVELLVVISIMQKARRQAQAAVCLTNLHQLGLATYLYRDDYGDYLPRGNWVTFWYELLMPYLGEEYAKEEGDYRKMQIFLCPSWPNDGLGVSDKPNSLQTVTYVLNGVTFEGKDDLNGHSINVPTKFSVFRHPALTVLVADNESGWWRPIIQSYSDPYVDLLDVWGAVHLPFSDTENISSGRRVAKDRHRDGANLLYVDGHVEWVSTADHTVDMWRE